MKHVSVGKVVFGNDLPFALIAGPCQMESAEHGMETDCSSRTGEYQSL